MIEIWEPRYKDKTVLIASSKIISEKDTELEITKGYYKGKYVAPWEVIKDCAVEKKPTKSGYEMNFTIVPLDKLVKAEE